MHRHLSERDIESGGCNGNLVRSEHDQLALDGDEALLFVEGEHLVARGEKGVEVGNGAARRQNTIAALPADNATHAFHHHRLHQDEHGRDLVCEHVGVGRCRQPLARHRHQVQAARQLVEEMRVTCVKVKIILNIIKK